MPGHEQARWDKALKAEKALVRIDVECEIDGIVERENITSLIRKNTGNREGLNGHDMSGSQKDQPEEISDAWVFSGSLLRTPEDGKPVYEANARGIVISIWPNPSAVIQYGKPTRNPYREANQGMAVNESAVPKEDTQVKLVFHKHDPLGNVLRDE